MNIKSIKNSTYIFFLLFVATTVALDGMLHTKYIIAMVAVTLATFSMTFLLLLLGEKFNKLVSFHIFVYLYFFWSALSFIWTSSPEETAWRLFLLNIYFMMLTLIFWYSINNKKTLYHVYSSFVVTIFLLALVTIYNFLNGIEEEEFTGRFTAYDIGTNEMSITLAIGLLLSLYLLNTYNSLAGKIFLIATIPIFIFSVFLTGSRTGFIVLVIALAFGIYQLGKVGLSSKVLTTISSVAAISFLYQYVPKELISRLFSTGHSISTGTLNEREVIWQIGFEGWKENPLLGSGVTSFEKMSNLAHMDLEAHNTYLSILVEYGVLGFVLYLLIIAILLISIVQLKDASKYFLLFLMLQLGLAQSTMNLQDNTILWALYAVIISHCWLSLDTKNRGNQ